MSTNNPAAEALGVAIRTAIDRAGTTRAQVARQLDVSPKTVYDACKTGRASLDTLDKLARLLGLGSVYDCLSRHYLDLHSECRGTQDAEEMEGEA